jgi:hypothetical protein
MARPIQAAYWENIKYGKNRGIEKQHWCNTNATNCTRAREITSFLVYKCNARWGCTFLWTPQTGFTSQFINQQDPPLPNSNDAQTQLHSDPLCPTVTAPSALQYQKTVLPHLFV